MDTALKNLITESFRDFTKLDSFLPGTVSRTIDGVKYTLERRGKIEYDYDADSESGDYHIYKATKGKESCFVKIKLWYTSYRGLVVSGYSFVTPVEKVVTVFE